MARLEGRPRSAAGREGGHVLFLALIVLLLTTAGSLLVVSALHLRQREVHDEATALRLTAMTDAAVAEALAGLGGTGVVRPRRHSFGGGEIAIKPVAASGTRRTLLVRADYAGKARQVELEVELSPAGPRVVGWRRSPP